MIRILLLTILLSSPLTSIAAILPTHEPLSILIIADEVNPHRLSDQQLTQPEDLAPALAADNSGLNIADIITVNSLCADAALDLLGSDSPPDVVLYFAHRGAAYCDGGNAQDILTQQIESGLQRGMGFMVLHHGLYVDFINRGAKAKLLEIIGADADSIEWNTDSGQRVINVAGDHFITSNGINYSDSTDFVGIASLAGNVAGGNYPSFTNVPDELYEVMRLHSVPGETRTPLFASDSGTPRTLGYVLQQPGWRGRVVAYQPAEYQPNALNDRDGANFQILVNGLYYAVYGETSD